MLWGYAACATQYVWMPFDCQNQQLAKTQGLMVVRHNEYRVSPFDPNAGMQALGFTTLEYDLNRDILIPGIQCPIANP